MWQRWPELPATLYLVFKECHLGGGVLTNDVNSLLTVIAITPKLMKAFMKVVILTNFSSYKDCHKSVVKAINVIM